MPASVLRGYHWFTISRKTRRPFLHGLCLPIKSLDESIVKLLRDHGKCIAVYTCNSEAEINKALELGVDILISDVPQKALQLRGR